MSSKKNKTAEAVVRHLENISSILNTSRRVLPSADLQPGRWVSLVFGGTEKIIVVRTVAPSADVKPPFRRRLGQPGRFLDYCKSAALDFPCGVDINILAPARQRLRRCSNESDWAHP